jgi:hypothetical protein
MKPARFLSLAFLILIFAFSTLLYGGVPQMINYQGKLTTPAGALIDDSLSVVFTIYDAATDGGVLWTETQATVIVEKGIFSVLLGSVNPIPDTVFTGDVRYLGVKVEADPEMTPRKEIVSVGYAYKAEYADTAAYAHVAVSDGDWTFRITDTADTTLVTGGEWGIARAGNLLYGNADSTHVNLGVACTTGTSGENLRYSTVGGGVRNAATGHGATVAGGDNNTASWYYSTIGGGHSNTASGYNSTVGGGYSNIASGYNSTVGGGLWNNATGFGSTVGGGDNSTASGQSATVAGGFYNAASGYAATIPGGYADTAAGDYSLASGLNVNITSGADYTFAFGRNFTTSTPNAVIFHNSVSPIKVGVGTTAPDEELHVVGRIKMVDGNQAAGKVLTSDANGVGTWQAAAGAGDIDWTFRITDTADTTLITGGEWGIARSGNVLYGNADSTHVNLGVACTTGTSGGNFKYSTVGGGLENTAGHNYATVGGGYGNTASYGRATVGGGGFNTASALGSTVGGGESDTASGCYSTVGGGWNNTASGWASTVAGGQNDTASADYTTVGGGRGNAASGWISTIGGGQYNTASMDQATVGGGHTNTASGLRATVAGGFQNTASATDATVGGGSLNLASWDYATVGGGHGNSASYGRATVAGGYGNTASGLIAAVGGGELNTASGRGATVTGGFQNTASIWRATVGGGDNNTASGSYATVPGGLADTAAGDFSFAAGDSVRISSDAHYTFAFGRDFTTSTPNAVIFHNSVDPIKVGIGTTSPTGQLDVNGNDIRIRTSQTPASSSADGYTGEIAWDANYIYICTSGDGPGGGTDTWKRAALSTW